MTHKINGDMSLDEFLCHKHNLAKSILKEVQDKINEFEDLTGCSPCSINIELYEISEIGGKSKMLVNEVMINIDL